MRTDTYDAMAKHEDTHWWYVARRDILASVIETFNLPEDAEILEAGAGTGGNTLMLKKFGQITVLEPNDTAQKYLQEKTGLSVINCSLPNTEPLKGKKFDLIVLFDVLEHIDDDISTLLSLQNHLKENGILFITVPAYAFLWGKHDEVHYHYRRYTKRNLQAIFNETNLSISSSGYFNTFLFPIIMSIRLLQKIFRVGGKDQDKLPSKKINKILCSLFRSERYFVKKGGFPFGVSLFAIAKNKS